MTYCDFVTNAEVGSWGTGAGVYCVRLVTFTKS